MRLRVLHILDHSLPLHSGYAFRTASILREQRALGWETIHLTSPKQGESELDEETADGWRFYRTRMRRNGLAQLPLFGELELMSCTARRIAQVVRSVRPHILHAHSPVLDALPALWVGRRFALPVVYELRALWEDAAVDHGTTTDDSARYRLSRALETFALQRAGHVTTICEGLRREIVSRGIPNEKVTVIPNAVDPHEFRDGGQVDTQLKVSLRLQGATVLGFAGSFYDYEGLDLLVDALAKLLPRNPGLRLLLVGGGYQEDALKHQVRSLGLENQVVFTGRVAHDQVQRYYDLFDVVVYPRRAMRLTNLVTPLKPLEAMAQGRVVVASDVGGHREMIRDGETGVLFRAGDADALAQAVARLLAQPQLSDAIRRAARHFVESERTWKRSVGRYAEVYGRLLPSGLSSANSSTGIAV